MRPSPWDLRLAARTVALAAVTTLVVALVEAISDERGAATARTGQIGVLPLVPLAGAIAVLVSLAPAVSAGELRALSAIGCSPWRARVAPIVCAAVLACAAGVVLSVRGEVSALYPAPVAVTDLRVVEDPRGVAFVSDRRRIRVGPAGSTTSSVSGSGAGSGENSVDYVLERFGPPPPSPTLADTRQRSIAAALAVALAGLALAMWAGAPMQRRAIGSVLGLTAWGVGSVVLFQAAGAGAVSPFATPLPSLLLGGWVILVARRQDRLAREDAWL